MTDTNPITTAFDIQRSAIEQTHQLTLEAIEAQTTAAHVAADSVGTFEQLAQQGQELSQEAAHAYLDAVEQALPEGDLEDVRELVDDGFAQTEELQAESWEVIHEAVEESVEGFDNAAETYEDVVDSSFDTFLTAHEQVEETADEFEEIDVSAD